MLGLGVKAGSSEGEQISIISLVDSLIEKAHKIKASDIHIDPGPKDISVRMRVDGTLRDIESIPKERLSGIISRIKVLAKLRTDEHQATQDGRFKYEAENQKESLDIRVAIAPTYYGENVVLRLLTDRLDRFSLENLGFYLEDKEKILKAIRKPSGMILATGPTGSGKTTTLYSLIRELNSREKSIVTIEDPIEYSIGGVKQIQVNPRIGLTFATGLRSILRQDPNIIMVGEIRDKETAGIAVNTALTGHLLLSSVHTNDAPTTIPRLLDMGIDPYLVASTLSLAIGQRLVRKICDECKEKLPFDKSKKEVIKASFPNSIIEFENFYKGKGCKNCHKTGFAGRICLNEVLVIDDEIREIIISRAGSREVRKVARRNGMKTMVEDGMEKIKQGQTTVEEVLKATLE